MTCEFCGEMAKTVARKKVSKPKRFTAAIRKKYLGMISRGVRRMKAARACGIHYNTVMNTVNTDSEFAEAVKLAELECVETVENDLFLACHKDRNPTSIFFFLQNRAPDRWQDRRNVNLSGSVGIGVTDDKIDAELQRLLEGRGANATEKPKAKVAKAASSNGSNGHAGKSLK